jgi:beta-lactamase regulating signal transducer with metallopeptidase domain
MTFPHLIMNGAVLTLVLKATIVLGVAAFAHILVARRLSAAMRHVAWATILSGLVLLPIAMGILPTWTVAVKRAPVWQSTAPAIELAAAPTPPSTPATSLDTPAGQTRSKPLPVTPPRTASVWTRGTVTAALVLVYLSGVLFLLARLARERFVIARLVRTSRPDTSPDWQRLLEDSRHMLGMTRRVRLLRSALPVSPMTWGIRTPTILIPDVADGWSEERRRAVMLHELAHVARWDCLTQVVAVVARTVYWMHPGVWWAARRLGVERELACDDRVLAAGIPPRHYASHLLEIARTSTRTPAAALARSLHTPSQLEGRMRAILDPSRRRAVPRLRTVLASAGMAAAVAALIAVVRPVPLAPPSALPDAARNFNGPSNLDSGNAVVVQSSDESRALDIVEELRIGGAAPDYSFGAVEAIAVGLDGTIFVADAAERRRQVRMYDADGKFVKAVGGMGTGPGEFTHITGMLVTPTGELAIYDVFNKRISLYDARGTFVRSMPSRVAGNWTGNDFHVDTDGNLYVFGVRNRTETPPPAVGAPVTVDSVAPRSNRFYLKLSARGDVLDTVDIPASRVSPQRGFVIMTPEAYLTPFQNELVYALAPTGRMVWGYTAEYAFTINSGASQARRIQREFTPVALHPAERAQWEARARFYDKDGPRSASYGVTIPAVKPAYRDLVVAEDGRIWVHRYAEASERTLRQSRRADAPPPLSWRDIPTFDVFEADGQYVGTVIVPNNTFIHVRRGAGLWGTNVLATGQTDVVRYRIK